jgi:undecaprenyl-diphosphatase
LSQYWIALLLGLVEGLTEFIPVSSTGRLLLLGHFLGFKSAGKTFEVLIQLGAIFAILSVYATRLRDTALQVPTDPRARRFVLGVMVAFLPAAVMGALAHDLIKRVLFESPVLVCINLVVGGLALLAVDRWTPRAKYEDATELLAKTAIFIGLFRCLALMPGVSRSGATVAGAMLLGVRKRAAAEFSFFVAMPTMTGAFTYDRAANVHLLQAETWC